jgi:hypothetical protein
VFSSNQNGFNVHAYAKELDIHVLVTPFGFIWPNIMIASKSWRRIMWITADEILVFDLAGRPEFTRFKDALSAHANRLPLCPPQVVAHALMRSNEVVRKLQLDQKRLWDQLDSRVSIRFDSGMLRAYCPKSLPLD